LSKGAYYFYSHTTKVEELRGLSQQLPLATVTFTAALAGLVGVPPLAGFTGKWFILKESLSVSSPLVYLGVVVFLINTLISLGYYLPLIGALYMPSQSGNAGEAGRTRIQISPWMAIPLLILGGLVLAIGLSPGPWLSWMAGVGDYLLALGR